MNRGRFGPDDSLLCITGGTPGRLFRVSIGVLLLASFIPGVFGAREVREEKRIEHLFQSLESLEGATFIRNRSEYNSKDAVSHLRLKLRMAGSRIKTAEDFIERCASKSSVSGEAYKIRFADGTFTETAPFFRMKLRELDGGPIEPP